MSGRAGSIADRSILADPNRNTSNHVFSNFRYNFALIPLLSRHVSQQVGWRNKLGLEVVQDPAVGDPASKPCINLAFV